MAVGAFELALRPIRFFTTYILFDMKFNDDFSKLIEIDEIIINERIRDMIYVKSKNLIVLVLENTPSVAILKKID